MFETLVDMAKEVLSENIVDITKYLGSKFSEKAYQPLVNKYIQKISNALHIEIPLLFSYKKELHHFVKWAGGKTQLLEKIKSLMPASFNNYFEPFIGGGALFFNIAPSKAVINDSNEELMCVYKCLKNDKFFELLKQELKKHEQNHSEKYYYQIRLMDQKEKFSSLPYYIRAGRMIYLNKACFNGLYRVNSNGYFNVPLGKKTKVKTFDEDNFEALHEYFKRNCGKDQGTDCRGKAGASSGRAESPDTGAGTSAGKAAGARGISLSKGSGCSRYVLHLRGEKGLAVQRTDCPGFSLS